MPLRLTSLNLGPANVSQDDDTRSIPIVLMTHFGDIFSNCSIVMLNPSISCASPGRSLGTACCRGTCRPRTWTSGREADTRCHLACRSSLRSGVSESLVQRKPTQGAIRLGPHSLGGLYRKQCLGIDGLRGENLGIGRIGTENFAEKVWWKSFGRTSVRTTKEPRATSGSIDHGAMHRWHHTVASLILGQLGDRVVCVKQCRYQRREDEPPWCSTGKSSASSSSAKTPRGTRRWLPCPASTRRRPSPSSPRGGIQIRHTSRLQGDHVRRTASTACLTTPRDHRSRPGSATVRMASGRPRHPGQDQVLQLGGTAPVLPGCFAPRSTAGSRSRRSEAQASGGDRQEIRRSVLDGAKARHATAATETLGLSREGGASAHEWGSARYWQARQ